MKTEARPAGAYEFCFPQCDTLVRVETTAQAVRIRASRDTFDARRKVAFVRELANEGFIADEYAWGAEQRLAEAAELQWTIDARWLERTPEAVARARRQVLRLIAGATGGWMALMTLLIWWHAR